MAVELLMPRQGNTVESCVILEWKKKEGDSVSEGDIVCEVETDKAAFEIEASASGTILKTFFEEGDDVPVLTAIAVIGEKGEDISSFAPEVGTQVPEVQDAREEAKAPQAAPADQVPPPKTETAGKSAISPRARNLAEKNSIDYTGLQGTGPGGRIIERDIQQVLSGRGTISPAAKEAAAQQRTAAPAVGSGIGGRVLSSDLAAAPESAVPSGEFPGTVTDIPVTSVRKIIAERMLASLTETAQLTLNASADARAILAYRKKLKNSGQESDFSKITINDIMLYAVSRVLPKHPFMNAHFLGDTIRQFSNVHLGMAVDTGRGLMVPVIKNADAKTLLQISLEGKNLAQMCNEGKAAPDDLTGGTFTVTNLGVFGIENFTPVLNPPEVGILGVCSIEPKPVIQGDETVFIPHIGLSLTINHQAVDGAPAARFLKDLADGIAQFEMLLAQ